MESLKEVYRQIPDVLKNKYALAFGIFLLWMTFVDTNTFVSQIKMQNQIEQKEQLKAYYETETNKLNESLDNLLNDNETLEKFAREEYLMKRDNEDVFVILEK